MATVSPVVIGGTTVGFSKYWSPSELSWSSRDVGPVATYDSALLDVSGCQYLKVGLVVASVTTAATPAAGTQFEIVAFSPDGATQIFGAHGIANTLTIPSTNLVYFFGLQAGATLSRRNCTVMAEASGAGGSQSIAGLGLIKVRLVVATSAIGTPCTTNLHVLGGT